MTHIILFIFVSPVLTQYAIPSGLRPDVTFGEDNDRFDISGIVQHQQNYFNDKVFDGQSEEYRRRGAKRVKKKHVLDIDETRNVPNIMKKDQNSQDSWLDLLNTRKGRKNIRKKIIRKLEDHVNQLANTIITKIRSLRRFNDFAYHDNMNSDEGNDDFEENLLKFKLRDRNTRRLENIVNKLHGLNHTRRYIPNPENEILLHYGFPVNMKIEGFLRNP